MAMGAEKRWYSSLAFTDGWNFNTCLVLPTLDSGKILGEPWVLVI